MTDLNSLKKIFKNKDLFNQAMTHKSWVNEHPGKRGTNERLEFLGDAVLEFIVSKDLYDRFPEKEEGYLTALRANLVNTTNLSLVAQKLAIGEALRLSKGEEETGGRKNPSLLADTLEAIIGALYIDQGIKIVRQFIQKNLLNDIPNKINRPLKDPKSRLQEYVQAQSLPSPKYLIVKETGPDHSKQFIVKVMIKNQAWGEGKGKNKSSAEQSAATQALKKIL